MHHLDVPWRPSDLQQRDGRILRQGNTNKEVEIIRYITQGTFDAYSYQLVENKQRFIAQIFTSKSPVRGAEDLDEVALSYAEVKALAAGNPAIAEKMNLDVEVSKLRLLKSNHQSEQYRLEKRVKIDLPTEIARLERQIERITKDITQFEKSKPADPEMFEIEIAGVKYDKRIDAGEHLMQAAQSITVGDSMRVGKYCGFELRVHKIDMLTTPIIEINGEASYRIELGDSALGNIRRIENISESLVRGKAHDEELLTTTREQLKIATAKLDAPFPQEAELQQKSARLTELNMELDVGRQNSPDAAIIDDDEPEPDVEAPEKKKSRKKEQER